jgi:asparagine synthase (glutamine-hydrolysing)
MCGIGGIYAPRGAAAHTGLLHDMALTLAHRGPDDSAVFVDRAVGLAHTRLSIIDIAGGHQPLANEDETVWITYNGEIYNYRELVDALEGARHRFRTRSDTEVVVHLYEDVGDGCVERLNGIFAFALWDSRRQRLVLARDPFGVKPLYYAQTSAGLVFASELKALLSSVVRSVDPTALRSFLSYGYVPSPRTLLQGVRKLPPGHLLSVDGDGIRLTRYADAPPPEPWRISEADAIELVQHEFAAAVARQMVSDAPIGAFLSGGVDSGAVVGAMAEHSGRVRTYSVGFAEGGDANELDDARETARRFATEHHEIVVSAEEYASVLPDAIWHLDEPLSTSSALPLFFLARLAGRDVKVALSGQGADEHLAGYTRYLGERYRRLWADLPSPARWVAAGVIEGLPRLGALERGLRSLAIADEGARFHQIHARLPDPLANQLLRPEVRAALEEAPGAVLEQWLPPAQPGVSSLARLQYVDKRTSLADDLLHYGDRMTMAHGVEMRVPFLDLQLSAVLERLPPELVLRGLSGKYLWKKAARRWLPASVVQRRKRGFVTPIDAWLRGGNPSFSPQVLLSASSAAARYLDRDVLAFLIADHQRGRRDYRRTLFALLSFEIWHQAFVEGQRSGPARGIVEVVKPAR